jgi:hypothetical protein
MVKICLKIYFYGEVNWMKKTNNEIVVGMTVYLKPINNAARRSKDVQEGIVSKVGRKYFEVEGFYRTKFSIDELIEVSEYAPDWKVYLSKQELLDEQEFENLLRDIRLFFSNYGKVNLTLDQLRKIKAIISE